MSGTLQAGEGWSAGGLGAGIDAGTADRRMDWPALAAQWAPAHVAQATQVHGAGLAVIMGRTGAAPVAGCDALLTIDPGAVLTIRTADCVPIFLADPRQRVVALAHAGWRGIAAGLPSRPAAAARWWLHARPGELRAAIGPAIRACCYEVGPEFEGRFGPFLAQRGGRRTCDLVAAAVAQLRQAGVREAAIQDSGACTRCDARWFSTRREGQTTGRLISFIRLR